MIGPIIFSREPVCIISVLVRKINIISQALQDCCVSVCYTIFVKCKSKSFFRDEKMLLQIDLICHLSTYRRYSSVIHCVPIKNNSVHPYDR